MAQTKSTEENLWKACDKLRGSVEPAEYKHVVLSLVFLKYVSDTYEKQREKLIAEGKERFVDMSEFYTKDNVFYVPAESRWSYIIANAKSPDISLKIDSALKEIEKSNKSLKGALPDNYFSRLQIETSKLAALLDTINNEDTLKGGSRDIIGHVYEYFLQKFAIKEGKGKGEFYTPKSIVNLIAELIEPYKGKIYDPCCGSGGMFIQSQKFVEAHQGNTKDIAVYGQELTNTTYKLAKMNLAIRGLSANLGDVAADTFSRDQHPDLKADFIMANPPFNLKDWREENELVDDPRWAGYDTPPTSNANYAWILHMLSKLGENGTAGFLLANGALSSDGIEKNIRKRLVDNDRIEAIMVLPRNMFYHTDISVTLWIMTKNKKARTVIDYSSSNNHERKLRDRTNEVLFMDLRQLGEPFEKKFVQFGKKDIEAISNTFHIWQTDNNTYRDIPEYCYSATKQEIESKNYSLVPSKYITVDNPDNNIDYSKEIQKLSMELKTLVNEEARYKQALIEVLEEFNRADQN